MQKRLTINFVTPSVSPFPLNSNKEACLNGTGLMLQQTRIIPAHNKPLDVVVYSSCGEVKLFKGVSWKKNRYGYQVDGYSVCSIPSWYIEAVGYSGNKQVNISNLKTAAEPSVIHMVADRTKIQADVQDLSCVEVSFRINYG